MNKTFTVIVLLYNNEEYLETCLDSVFEQDYPEIDIIVVDDFSASFNKEVIEEYIRAKSTSNIKHFIVYQNESNFGTVKSANGALQKSRGQYIKLLAADDALFNSSSLSKAALALDQSPDGIITSDVMKCDEHLEHIGIYHNNLQYKLNEIPSLSVFRRLCVHNDIVAGGVFFSKSFFETYGFFDETYRLLEDWPTWLKCVQRGCRIQYVSFWGIRYRSNSGVGTSINPIYLSDKKKVFENIISPAKREIGFFWYLISLLSITLRNSYIVRALYGFLFRKKK